MIVLDTDHMSLAEGTTNGDALRLRARLDQLPPEERSTTIITYEEQTRGWLKYVAGAKTVGRKVDAYRKLHRHLRTYRRMVVLDFDEQAAVEFQRLRGMRLRIGLMDLLIASIVLARGATLATRNLRDFRQVPGLRVEDWTV